MAKRAILRPRARLCFQESVLEFRSSLLVKVGPVAFHDSLGKLGEAEVRVMLIQKLGPGFEEVRWQCWALQEKNNSWATVLGIES